jgi:methylenetetrahydromethanopterin dehydrogenase
MANIVKVGVFKCGNIGAAPVLELLLDELAEREDIRVRTVTTGSKMNVEDVEETLPKLLEFNPDLIVSISPNAGIPGPAKAREILSNRKIPCIVISDAPAKKVTGEIEKQGLGYIIILGDPLIGARREFLDPVEMAIFNSNIIKVLAATGILRVIHQEIDKIITAVKEKQSIVLPKLVLDTEYIRDNSDFRNPYAKAKAMAAYELTKKIAEIDQKACFVEKEKEKYIPLVACAHEIAQTAARLAEEAREIEKYTDTLVRKPHSKEGKPLTKTNLLLSPKPDEETYRKWHQSQ